MSEMLHEIKIAAQPKTVFDALTTTEGLRGWWTRDAEAKPEVGSETFAGFDDRKTVFRLRCEELEPESRVHWRCVGEDKAWEGTHLIWLLTPEGNGTRLRFTHGGWRGKDDDYAICNSTWGALMFQLRDYAQGQSPGPLL